jgi:ABC-type branched-subunit amino acid transport system substrate-binding protein
MVAAAAVVALLAAACSSSSHTASNGGPTYTVGILADITGAASSSTKTIVQGVQAGANRAKQEGYTIHYVVADTATNPSQVLSGAQRLVEEDHVFAVIAASALFYSAAPYLTAQGIPVVGWSVDGDEWLTSPNMFSPNGPSDPRKVATTWGIIMQKLGVRTFGSVGYSVSLSAEATKGAAASAQAVGIKVGYVNSNLPLGSTDVMPEVLAMKSAGVEGVMSQTDSNTALLVVSTYRQVAGNLFKAALLTTGYGSDLLEGGPGAVQAAQGVYFDIPFEPVGLHTAATQQFQSNLQAVGVTSEPTFAEYIGYTSIDLLVQGIKGAGTNPTHASVIKALDGIHAYNGAGLFGSHTVDMSARTGDMAGIDNCLWVTKLVGTDFQPVPGMQPICGQNVPGKTIPAS